MINNFKNIGQSVLRKSGYYDTADEMEKRKIFLFHQSLIPYVKKDKDNNAILSGKAICFNFFLKNKQFRIQLSDKDLTETNREYFCGFRLGAPKDKKKFLITNNVDTIYSAVFKESVEYIDDKLNKAASREWIRNNISNDYRLLMENIFNTFYIKDQHFIQKGSKKEISFYLNYDLLIDSQKDIFLKIFNDEYEHNKSKVSINELYNRFINKFYFSVGSKDTKNFPSLFMILFDGESILDYDNRKYAKDYLNLCYYDIQHRFITEKCIKDKICHICTESKSVIHDIPFPMKFYGTTNYLNFENLSSSSAYKSFAMCNDCLIEVQTGMKHIADKFSEPLFDTGCYLIPHIEQPEDFNEKMYNPIIRILKTSKQEYKNEIVQIQELLEKANRKNVLFDLMFYFSPPNSQQFDVHKLVSNIELNNLILKLNMFDEYSEKYELMKIGDNNNSLTISDLRYYLFPSFFSHGKNPDFNIFGKNLLNFLEGFLTNRKIDYYEMVNRFIEIYRRCMNNNKSDILAPFKMILALTIFMKLNILKKGVGMKEGSCTTEISKKEYQQFFETHWDIYGGNMYRQGLFLLGTVISKIKLKQHEKSSNFLKKLNFNGMPARRVPNLVNQVREFSNIYKVFEERGIWGNIMDRLQGVENSDMKPDEVVFYLLTGISFEDYLGMKFSYEQETRK
jgi:CRISPR-associated protein Csh1